MKFLKLSLFVFPLLISNPLMAADDIDEDITNPGTGTFPLNDKLSDKYSQPAQKMDSNEQLEMEKEEAELDGFGEDTYNENVDPDVYQVDEDVK